LAGHANVVGADVVVVAIQIDDALHLTAVSVSIAAAVI
jgi:hypothetical protein